METQLLKNRYPEALQSRTTPAWKNDPDFVDTKPEMRYVSMAELVAEMDRINAR